MSQKGELSQIIEQLIMYIKDKYQIPDFSSYLLLNLLLEAFEVRFGYRPLDLRIYEKSIHAPALSSPLWLKALSELTKISQQTNIIQEIFSKKKLHSLRGD